MSTTPDVLDVYEMLLKQVRAVTRERIMQLAMMAGFLQKPDGIDSLGVLPFAGQQVWAVMLREVTIAEQACEDCLALDVTSEKFAESERNAVEASLRVGVLGGMLEAIIDEMSIRTTEDMDRVRTSYSIWEGFEVSVSYDADEIGNVPMLRDDESSDEESETPSIPHTLH